MKRVLRRGAQVYLLALAALLLLGLFWQQRGLEQNVSEILAGGSARHWLGTDALGRDLFHRLLQGGQISLSIALVTTFLAFLLGVGYGALAGWCEGPVDRTMMRLLDIFMSVPSFVTVSILCLGLQFILPWPDGFLKSFCTLILAISFTHWMGLARVTRGLVMETKRKPFVEAARGLGARPERIFYAHIFPNIRGRLLALAALQIPTHIMYESYMSFIGLGMQPPWTSWGLLLQEGWKTLAAFPHLMLYPSLILFLTVWSLNLVLDQD